MSVNNPTPPPIFDWELEQVVLSGFFLNPDLFAKYSKKLQGETFTNTPFRRVFEAMVKVAEANETIDIITVRQKDPELKPSQLAAINILPPQYTDISFSDKKLGTYVQYLLDLEVRRMAYDGGDAKQIADRLTRMNYNGQDKFLTPDEVATWFAEEYKQGTMRQNGIPYPFKIVNNATKGIQPGQLVIVGARPSVGKSTFLQNIAVEANRHGAKVLFATAEMSIMMTAQRVLSQLLQHNMFDDDGTLDPESIKKTLKSSQIFYHQFSSTSELEERIRDNRENIDLILVDYIQIIEPKGKYKSQFEKTGMVVNDLVQLKTKYNIPIVAASQFNREADGEQPSMADFYESGKIEQAADIIFSLWQHDDDKQDSTYDRKKIRIDLLKNRNGKTFTNFYNGRDDVHNQEFVLFFKPESFEFEEPMENIFNYDVKPNLEVKTPSLLTS